MQRIDRAIPRPTRRALVLALAATLLVSPAVPRAEEAPPPGCTGFQWDLSAEIALFATPGTPLASGAAAAAAPTIEIGRLYAVALVPQASVTLPHAPGKPRLLDGARAALLAIDLPDDGRYRVTIDDGSWIDVVIGTELIAADRFQGRSSCRAFHKSVEYTLPRANRAIVQITGSASGIVRVAVTRAP